MEQKEKIEKPRWVSVLEEHYKPIVHQLVGNLCGNLIQTCMNLYGLDEELYFACIEEVESLITKVIEKDADVLVDEIVKDAQNENL